MALPIDILIHELREAYNKEWTVKQGLEDKAARMIAVVAIILPVFLGLFLNAFTYTINLLQFVALLVIFVSGVMSLIYSMLVLKPIKYSKMMDIKTFWNYEENDINYEMISKFKTTTEEEKDKIKNSLIDDYIHVLKNNRQVNALKADRLNKSITSLIVEIIRLFPILLFL